MLTTTIDWPHDALLGKTMHCMDPDDLLQACREQLTRVPQDRRDAWRHCRMIEALYDPGRYLRVAYAMLDDPTIPENRIWPEGDIIYLNAPVRQPMSRRGTVLTIGGVPVEVYRFPNDRRLRGLRKFASPQRAAEVWQQWLDDARDAFRIDPATVQRLFVRYVPEQKWVVRLRARGSESAGQGEETRRIAVRATSPDDCQRLHRRHELLSGRPRPNGMAFDVPGVVGVDISAGLLAVEWRRGESLLTTLGEGSADDVLQRVATALAAFHATDIEGLERLTTEKVRQRMADAVRDLSAASPSLEGRLSLMLGAFGAMMDDVRPGDLARIHNDFHWNQVNIKRQHLAILDLERMCLGDPLIDVANFVTQIRLLGSRADQTVDTHTAARWADLFLEQWDRVGSCDLEDKRMRCYGALSAMELARGMMRHLRTGWRSLLDHCLHFAERQLAGEGEAAGGPR